MSDDARPQRLVPTAVAAFKAAHEVPWGVKAVWVEDWILDRGPEASWISATHLAERLGMSKDNVEAHRRWLLARGFYHVVRRPGAKSDGWVPTLPLGCRHHGTTVEMILATARRIDDIVTGTTRPIEDGVARTAARGVARTATNGVATAASNGVAEYATPARGASLIQPPSEGQTLAQSQVRTREGAHAPKAEKEGEKNRRLAAERSTLNDGVKFLDNDEPTPRAIDQRPRQDVEAEGWEKLRQRHAERRRQQGGA